MIGKNYVSVTEIGTCMETNNPESLGSQSATTTHRLNRSAILGRRSAGAFIGVAGFVYVAALVFWYNGERQGASNDPAASVAASESSVASATPTGQYIPVPSDPHANYYALTLTRGLNDGEVILTTHRDGPSGTSYTKRLNDCIAHTYRYLGDGDTIEEMNSPSPAFQRANANPAAIASGSISDFLWNYACSQAPNN